MISRDAFCMWGTEPLIKAFKEKGLTHRESEVAYWVSKGITNQAVADQLFVTEKTIKFHLTRIYYKMGIKSRAQLIVWSMPFMRFAETKAAVVAENIQAVQPAPPYILPTSTKIGNA